MLLTNRGFGANQKRKWEEVGWSIIYADYSTNMAYETDGVTLKQTFFPVFYALPLDNITCYFN